MRLPLIWILFSLLWTSCEKEAYYSNRDATLKFSSDTIAFDTIFTSVGTATKRLMVYNSYDKIIKISSIKLAGGSQSSYIMNVNGIKTNNASDIEIYPNDSLYIFIQVLINPIGNNLPLLINDSIIFTTNGNPNQVTLKAYGQDVHLLKGGNLKSQTWTADKPYLIYGDLTLDTLETLNIEKGTKLYFHKNANLKIKGSINVNGETGNPVTFEGDRQEIDYKDIPGQWGGIIFLPGSLNNTISYAIIKNGTSGIQAGTAGNPFKNSLLISNSIIQNMSYDCLLSNNSTIKAINCVFANGSTYTCGLFGGSYQFYHCTLVNYSGSYSIGIRYPVVYLSNYASDPSHSSKMVNQPLTMASFYNTIAYGNNYKEVTIENRPPSVFIYKFDHCLLRGDNINFDKSRLDGVIWNQSPRFKAPEKMIFELDTLSPAKDAGDKQTGNNYPFDITMKSRITDKGPDLGAYERVEK